MLEKILGTSGKVSLLRVMLAGKGKDFSLNELARLSGLSTSTTFKEIKDLAGTVVDYNHSTKRYSIHETPLTIAVRDIFELEKKMYKTADATIFSLLSDLGAHYVSGTSAIILRESSRENPAPVDSMMVICDRKVSKLRGALMSLFPSHKLLFLEEDVKPTDFVQREVHLKKAVMKVNLAKIEKALVDALWKPDWEGENITLAVRYLIEKSPDVQLLKKYAAGKGPKVQARLKETLETIGRATGNKYRRDDLGTARAPKGFRKMVEGAVKSVQKGQALKKK
jgi:hypothetical protein